MSFQSVTPNVIESRLAWARELKSHNLSRFRETHLSRLAWARELKFHFRSTFRFLTASRLAWARELKF